jgi:hypothetical protein
MSTTSDLDLDAILAFATQLALDVSSASVPAARWRLTRVATLCSFGLAVRSGAVYSMHVSLLANMASEPCARHQRAERAGRGVTGLPER